jgi:hypothetical protein
MAQDGSVLTEFAGAGLAFARARRSLCGGGGMNWCIMVIAADRVLLRHPFGTLYKG